MTLQFQEWPSKTIEHLFHTHSSFMYHFIAIGEFRFKLQTVLKHSNWVKFDDVFASSDLEILWMTLKNYRAPLLCPFELCAPFCSHQRIPIWVTSGNGQIWFWPRWPWTFEWTSLLSLVITTENFIMVRWHEYSQKGVTDGQTDWTIHRVAWSQLNGMAHCQGILVHLCDQTPEGRFIY